MSVEGCYRSSSLYRYYNSDQPENRIFKMIQKEQNGLEKVEISEAKIIKVNYDMNKMKKLKEMKENLKRTNIQEEKAQDDLYTIRIEPGCYNEIIKKFQSSVIGDEINDESAGSEKPVGIKMKLTDIQGLEENKGARVTTQLTWKVTDLRSQEEMKIQHFLYHSKQTIMLQGGKLMGKKTTGQLCADLIRPIMNRIIVDKRAEIMSMRNSIHNMNLRQRPPVFKCDECEYNNSSEVRLKSHKNTYHGNGWTQVKRSHNGRQKTCS